MKLHTTPTRATVSVLAALSLLPRPAHGQTAGAVNQFDTTQQRRAAGDVAKFEAGTNAPEFYPGETQDVGPQSVLKLKPRRTLFEGIADMQYFYTDNALLDHTYRVPAMALVSSVQAAVAPTPYQLGPGFSAPRVGIRQQWYDFHELNSQNPPLRDYDFIAQSAFIEEHWAWHDWNFGGGFDDTRLVTPTGYHQFYNEMVPRYDISRQVHINERQLLSLTYQGYYHFTSASGYGNLSTPPTAPSTVQVNGPSDNLFDRLDQVATVGYVWAPTLNCIVQPYYAYRYTRYTSNVTRDDHMHSFGLALYFFAGQHCNARIFTSYDKRYSSIPAAEFTQFSTGLGVDLSIKF
jgi:hypothetical protein